MEPSAAPLAPASINWLPGLADIALGDTLLVTDGSRPAWRHIHLGRATRSQAIHLGHRLELRVAPGDEGFALALIAAFAAPDHAPAAAARASRDLLALAARVAASQVSVLIEGATGTGKEGLARLVQPAGDGANPYRPGAERR
jgi:two-component system response regulator FlrC